MKNNIKIIEIADLKAHEKTSPKREKEIMEFLKKSKSFTRPIIVDKETLTILDGHHRVKTMKYLGYKKIPAMLVDYKSNQIKVNLRSKGLKVLSEDLIKFIVTSIANSGLLLPQKTTRHLVSNRLKSKIDFAELK